MVSNSEISSAHQRERVRCVCDYKKRKTSSTAYKYCSIQAQLTNSVLHKHMRFFFESPASRRAFFPFSELLGKRRDEKSIMRRFDSCLILSEAYMNMLCFPRTVSKLTSQLPHALGAGSEVDVSVF